MNKGLEALEKIRDCVAWCAYDGKEVGVYESSFNIIEEELKENEYLKTELLGQSQELNVKNKALEIIKEKGLDIRELMYSYSLYEYNTCKPIHFEPLTQEEFNLLKEVLSW